MFVLIVGCGRVGSSVARTMLREGHEVSCLDEDSEAHARLEVNLDSSWEDAGGQFTVGTGLEEDALLAAGIQRADGDRADSRPPARRVVREAGSEHDLSDARRDRDARGGSARGGAVD